MTIKEKLYALAMINLVERDLILSDDYRNVELLQSARSTIMSSEETDTSDQTRMVHYYKCTDGSRSKYYHTSQELEVAIREKHNSDPGCGAVHYSERLSKNVDNR